MNIQGLGRLEPRELLRAVGLRVTAPRLAVLDWLSAHPHATADQVAAGVRERLDSVSTQAIYDVLHACARANLVRRIEPAGRGRRGVLVYIPRHLVEWRVLRGPAVHQPGTGDQRVDRADGLPRPGER